MVFQKKYIQNNFKQRRMDAEAFFMQKIEQILANKKNFRSSNYFDIGMSNFWFINYTLSPLLIR
jgi:hypothetical protein